MRLIRPTLIVIFDSVKDEMVLVTPVRPVQGVSAREAYQAAQERLAGVAAALDVPLPRDAVVLQEEALELPEPESNTTPAEYMAMVARAKEYIAAGDVFQVVLSQRFSIPFPLPPFALYRSLRELIPPFRTTSISALRSSAQAEIWYASVVAR